jgi:hypothetical protein
MDVEEYLLHKIVCLGFIPENPSTNIPDQMSVSPEEQSKSVVVAMLDACDKSFIVGFGQGCIGVRVDAIVRGLPIGQRQKRKSGSSSGAQD